MSTITSTRCRSGAAVAGLLLVLAVGSGPVAGAGASTVKRTELTGKLVPITGEDTRSVDLTVPFAKNSAKLTKPAREQLDELGAALAGEELRAYGVGVYGHTDASGAAEYNRKLSEERAKAVVAYLVERAGLDRARFRHGGYGEERLLEGIAAHSPRHRRVEIVVSSSLGETRDAAGAGEEEHDKTGEGKPEPKEESGLQAIP